jgi:nifR3 family TIM-barrel protein
MSNSLYHPVAVGRRVIPGNVFLAPVAGYSDAAFRSVAFDLGADLCYTEMVSSEALVRGHPGTALLLHREPNETRYAIQLFGSKPDVLARAARIAAARGPELIDLNCGCPVPKIVKSGSGSALMKRPELIYECVAAMREELGPEGPPVTVKIRLGWDSSSVNYLEVARGAVEAGASAVTLHARTKTQGYAGNADWTAIKRLVDALEVPVFGSGDVFDARAAARMLEETGCAGVMIARGAMGNPFIFRETKAILEGRSPEPPAIAECVMAARRHLELSVAVLGERTACAEFRKQFCSYTKGTVGGAELRSEAVRASSQAQFEDLLDRWLAMSCGSRACDTR